MIGSAVLFFFLSVSSVFSAVQLNEVAFDHPTGSPDWVELYNTGPGPVSIQGWTLDDEDTASGNETVISLSTPVPAGAFVVVFLDALGTGDGDFSDNVSVVYSGTTTTVNLAATEDELSLYSGSLQNSTTLVDFVAWMTDGNYGGVSDQTNAVNGGLWLSGTAVPLEDTGYDYSLGRKQDGMNTHLVSDWRAYAVPTRGTGNIVTVPPVDGDCSTDSSCTGQTSPVTDGFLWVDPSRNPFSPRDSNPSLRSARFFFNVGTHGVVKTLHVVDVRGRIVRTLLDNDISSTGGSFTGVASGAVVWDGLDRDGVVLPMGVYIIFLEGVDPSGGRRTDRQTVVLGSPFP